MKWRKNKMYKAKSKCIVAITIGFLLLSMVLAGVQINPAEAQVVSLSLEPDFGPVGSKVKVSGTTDLTPSTSKPVRIYWSANETLELAADTLLASITKPKTAGGCDFETTITIPTIPPISSETPYYVIAWQDANGDGSG